MAAHRIRHYVYGVPGDRSTLIPREASMRGAWACEAKCSCGWETRSGGAVRSFIDREVREHRFDVEHGFWSPPAPVAEGPDYGLLNGWTAEQAAAPSRLKDAMMEDELARGAS